MIKLCLLPGLHEQIPDFQCGLRPFDPTVYLFYKAWPRRNMSLFMRTQCLIQGTKQGCGYKRMYLSILE